MRLFLICFPAIRCWTETLQVLNAVYVSRFFSECIFQVKVFLEEVLGSFLCQVQMEII